MIDGIALDIFKDLYKDPNCFIENGTYSLYTKDNLGTYVEVLERDNKSYLEWNYKDITLCYYPNSKYWYEDDTHEEFTVNKHEDGKLIVVHFSVKDMNKYIRKHVNDSKSTIYKFIIAFILAPMKTKYLSYDIYEGDESDE